MSGTVTVIIFPQTVFRKIRNIASESDHINAVVLKT